MPYSNTVMGTLGALGLFAFPAHAQTPAAPGQDSASTAPGDGEIVVTARKTAEKLLDVPLAVTALSGAQIERRDISDFVELTRYTPSFTLTNNVTQRNDRSYQSLAVRGVAPYAGSINPTTSVYIDGTVVSSGFVEGVSNLERVEILKGPQSAAFGRSAFAGAINLVTQDPSNDFHAAFDGTYGSYNYNNSRLTVEGPIVKDILAFRLSGRLFGTDGQYRNVADGTTLGDQETRSLAATLLFTPSDNLKIKLFALGWKDDDGPTSVAKFNANDFNCNAGLSPAGTRNYICGTLPSSPTAPIGLNDVLNAAARSRFFGSAANAFNPIFSNFIDHLGLGRRAFHGHVSIDYSIPGTGFTLTSLTGLNREKRDTIVNSIQEDASALAFGTPPAGALFNFPYVFAIAQNHTSDVSQELRLTSPRDTAVRFLIGANYAHTATHSFTYGSYLLGVRPVGYTGVPNGSGAPFVFNGVFNQDSPIYTDTYGVFGSVSFDLTPTLTITGDARYQIDDAEAQDQTGMTLVTARYKSFSPRAVVQWKPHPDALIYASISRGANPGTFNTFLLTYTPAAIAAVNAVRPTNLVVGQERMTSYEAGYKGRFFDNRVTLSADVYFAQWRNQILQDFINISPIAPLTVRPLNNSGATDLNGIELEGSIRLSPQLTAQFNYSLNDTKIKQYSCGACFASLTGSYDVRGNELPGVARNKGGVVLEWRDRLTSTADWYASGDYQYRDGMWDTAANLAKTASYSLVNLRLGVQRGGATVEAFVLNAFDQRYYTSISFTTDAARGSVNAIVAGLGTRRSYGIRLAYKL